MWLAGTAHNSCFSPLGTAPCHTGLLISCPTLVCIHPWCVSFENFRSRHQGETRAPKSDPTEKNLSLLSFPLIPCCTLFTVFSCKPVMVKDTARCRDFLPCPNALSSVRTQQSARASSASPAVTLWQLWCHCSLPRAATEGVSGFHLPCN